jgi:DNA-binding transcriptional LysR family regulator
MKEGYVDRIKLSQLRALVAVAECENFTEAALQLNVSQSAISHAIASLEEEVGVVLVSRGRHGATLTPVGEAILVDAQNIMRSIEEIGHKADTAKGLEGGQVRVASFRSVSTHILPAVIAKFRQTFPAIAISLTEHQNLDIVEQQLRHGLADIGFTYLPTSEEFETWELFRDDYVVLLPPSAAHVGDPITWEELKQYPLIVTPGEDGCRMLLRREFSKCNQTLNVAFEVREDSTIVSMVGQGLGAAIIARLAAEPLPTHIPVRRPPIPLERVIGIATLREALHTPAVYAFLDALKRANPNASLPAPAAGVTVASI